MSSCHQHTVSPPSVSLSISSSAMSPGTPARPLPSHHCRPPWTGWNSSGRRQAPLGRSSALGSIRPPTEPVSRRPSTRRRHVSARRHVARPANGTWRQPGDAGFSQPNEPATKAAAAPALSRQRSEQRRQGPNMLSASDYAARLGAGPGGLYRPRCWETSTSRQYITSFVVHRCIEQK